MKISLMLFLTAVFAGALFPIGGSQLEAAPGIRGTVPAKVWIKDPFAPPLQVEEWESVEKPLTLSAILYSSVRSTAVIDGRMVRVGDRVGAYKVIVIKKTYVILQKGSELSRMELKR